MDDQELVQRAYDLRLALEGHLVVISTSSGDYRGNAHTLAILDEFATPRTLKDGLDALRGRVHGVADWISLSQEVLRLRKSGVLAAPSSGGHSLPSSNGDFASPNVHIRMLNDRARTLAFQRAIKSQVTRDDVVLDIGTGTGILAATAALAGARHVYAIERTTNLARLARRFFAHNGLSDRITVIEGDSIRLDLPERASVFVGELIGNDPLCERILESTVDARRRLLTSDARLIPNRLRIYGLPITMPEEHRSRALFSWQSVSKWRNDYGLDFSIYAEFCAKGSFHSLLGAQYIRDWDRLAPPFLIADIDFYAQQSGLIESSTSIQFEKCGMFNALFVYFEADLGPDICLSLHPDRAAPENHWANFMWIPGAPRAVSAQSRFNLRYTYGVDGKGSSFSIEDAQ